MKKLKQQQGATIFMALLLLLAATVVSVAILTAATTAAHHLENDRASQQAYLTVSSAAELLRDDIENSAYTVEVSRTMDGDGTVTKSSTTVTGPSGVMKQWLEKGMKRLGEESFTSYSDTITLSAGADSGMDEVKAEFFMAENYDITVRLSLAGGGDADCRMTLTLRGSSTQETKTLTGGTDGSILQVTTTQVRWELPQIEKGAGT